jgi:anti-sigma factor RsiW
VTGACASPVAWDTLADYWAGDLPPPAEEAVDEHLMGCAACSAVSARVAAIAETLRTEIPPVITGDELAALRARGLRIVENPMAPGARKPVVFPAGVDLLIHRLGGLDLTRATRVAFILRVEGTGRVLVDIDDAPFDRAAGAVLVACQKHFAALPPDTVAEVRARDAAGAEVAATYTILHRFDGG